jgi:hypothetical protein
MYLDIDIGRRNCLLTEILPSFLHVILVSEENPRRIKRLKVQTCLHSDSGMKKALPLQALGHDISHNGRFLRRFLAISSSISYNTSKAESTLILVVFPGRRYA